MKILFQKEIVILKKQGGIKMSEKLTKLCISTQMKLRKFKEEKVKPFFKDERGDITQTGFIIAFFIVVAAAAFTILKDPILNLFNKIKTTLESDI